MCRCGDGVDVDMWKCGHVEMWTCVDVEMCRCGHL